MRFSIVAALFTVIGPVSVLASSCQIGNVTANDLPLNALNPLIPATIDCKLAVWYLASLGYDCATDLTPLGIQATAGALCPCSCLPTAEKATTYEVLEECYERRNETSGGCPEPLIQNPNRGDADAISPFPCYFQCRTNMYTEDEQDFYDTWQVVLSSVSLVCIVWSIAYNVMNEFRRGHMLVLALLFASFWIVFSIVLGNITANGDYADFTCQDAVTARDQDHASACTVFGVFLMFGASGISYMWFFMILNLALQVGVFGFITGNELSARERTQKYADLWKYFIPIGFGMSALNVIIPLGLGHMGGSPPQTFCGYDDKNISWAFFYGQVTTLYASGMPMMIMTVYKIAKQLKNISTWRQDVRIHYVPVMLGIVFGFFLINVLSNKIVQDTQLDGVVDSAQEQYSCLVSNFCNFLNPIDDPAHDCAADQSAITSNKPECGCGTEHPKRIPLVVLYMNSFTVHGQGLFVFLIFGLGMCDFSCFKSSGGQDSGNDGGKDMELTSTAA